MEELGAFDSDDRWCLADFVHLPTKQWEPSERDNLTNRVLVLRDGSLAHYVRSKTYFVLMHFWVCFVDIGEEKPMDQKPSNLEL